MTRGTKTSSPLALWIGVGIAVGAGIGTAIHNIGAGVGAVGPCCVSPVRYGGS